MRSISTPLLSTVRPGAVVAAALLAGLQLVGVTTLAQHHGAAHADGSAPRLVQLERVVITGKRVAAVAQATTSALRADCDAAARPC